MQGLAFERSSLTRASQRRSSQRTLNAKYVPSTAKFVPKAVTSSTPLLDLGAERRDWDRLPEPEGSLGLPFFGESFDYAEKGVLRFGLERCSKYGPIFKTHLWGSERVMVCDMGMYKAIMDQDTKLVNFTLSGTFPKVQGPFAQRILGNENGARMPFRRQMLTALTADALKNYATSVAGIAEQELEIAASGPTFELNMASRKWGFSFANALLAGLEDLTAEEEKEIARDMELYVSGFFTFDVNLPGTPMRKALDARSRMLARIRRSVEQQADEITKEKPSPPGTKARKNLLGYMIDSYRADGIPLDVEDMAYMALGVLNAGTDTSSSGFSSMFVIVSELPEVFAKIREEQDQVVATEGPQLTKKALDSMKYLDAVAHEVMRINSAAPAQFRTALKDLVIGGKRIPAGTDLVLNGAACQSCELGWDGNMDQVPTHMDLHRLRESFKPERWLDPQKKPSIMTFGHGPHTCVGMALYFMEAKALMALTARKYDLTRLTQDIDWMAFPVVRPKGDVLMSLTPRTNHE